MAITAGDMRGFARRQMHDGVGTRANTIIAEAISGAMLRLAQNIGGSYWLSVGELALQAAYSTGTIQLTNASATATLTGGTWPSWAAEGNLLVDGQWYEVDTRTSNSAIELATNWNQSSVTASAFVIYQNEYSLASDMMELHERAFYGDDWVWGAEPVSFEELLKYQEAYDAGNSLGHVWARRQDKIVIAPYPTEARTVKYLYTRRPAGITSNTADATNLDVSDSHKDVLECAITVELAERSACVISYPDALEMWRRAFESVKDIDESQNRPSVRWIKGGFAPWRRRDPKFGSNP